MSELASNAKNRGDAPEALRWYEEAFNKSEGPATRLQWGSSYVNALVDLAPQDEARIETHLLGHATKPQILARMLLNLKRVYVRMHSFPQARDVTELLLAVDPSAINELRDRGLLAYHLKDFSAALRDLQAYLQLSATTTLDEEEREGHAQIWEHVKTLRRRVASLN